MFVYVAVYRTSEYKVVLKRPRCRYAPTITVKEKCLVKEKCQPSPTVANLSSTLANLQAVNSAGPRNGRVSANLRQPSPTSLNADFDGAADVLSTSPTPCCELNIAVCVSLLHIAEPHCQHFRAACSEFVIAVCVSQIHHAELRSQPLRAACCKIDIVVGVSLLLHAELRSQPLRAACCKTDIVVRVSLLLHAELHSQPLRAACCKRPWETTSSINIAICEFYLIIMADDAKAERAHAKRLVTNKISYIRRLLVEDRTSTLAEEKDNLMELFSQFEEKQCAYHETLIEDSDIVASEIYFVKEQDSYVDTMRQIKLCLGNVPSNDLLTQSTDSNNFDKLLTALNRPKVTIKKFSGNCKEFYSFLKCFDLNIDSVCDDPEFKLTCLLENTTGHPHEMIESCVFMSKSEGYTTARKRLVSKYGDKNLIAIKILEDVARGKPVKSADEISKLAVDLVNAKIILKEIGMIGAISTQFAVQEIVGRLPNYLKNKFCDKTVEANEKAGAYLGFEDLCTFVESAAKKASDSLFGENFRKKKSSGPASSSGNSGSGGGASGSSFNTSGKQRDSQKRSEPPCVLCSQPHRLWHCALFRSKTPRERLNIVDSNSLCRNCFLPHATASCSKRTTCFVKSCNARHSMWIHIDGLNSENSDSSDQTSESKESAAKNEPDPNLTNACTAGRTAVHMPICRVLVNGKHSALAMLDSASSNTFCTKALSTKLGLKGSQVRFTLDTLNGTQSEDTEMVSMSVSSLDGDELQMSGVYLVDNIPVRSSKINLDKYDHLRDIPFTVLDSVDHVDLLIGQDFHECLYPIEVCRGPVKSDPWAFRSLLGWCLNGRDSGRQVHGKSMSTYVTATQIRHAPVNSSLHAIEEKCDRLWRIENEGISDQETWSQEDKHVIDFWDRTCKKVGKHYVLPIPLKDPKEIIPNNYVVAKSVLDSLSKRLEKENLYERYESEIDVLLKEGYAEQVPNDEIDCLGQVWYVPHHHVISDKKPDKLRIVYNCAAKYQGKSLNDRCYQGPNLIKKLVNILLRFRMHKYGVQGDLKAMYFQVVVPEEQRDLLRFLWYTDQGITHYRMTRHLFGGVWCASASAYALQRIIKDNSPLHPVTMNVLSNCFYVDDCLASVEDEAEVKLIIDDTSQVLKDNGFEMLKLLVNDIDILKEISPERRAKEAKELTPDIAGRTLGVMWDVKRDAFFFVFNPVEVTVVTRRIILSVVSSVYDPLGLLSPLILAGKVHFQNATRLKLAWDDEVPIGLCLSWKQWLSNFDALSSVRIPRCVKMPAISECTVELHTFTDASLQAYGAASYLRCVDARGNITCHLLASKNRLAPLKQSTSVPRLELMGCLLGAQLSDLLKRELHIRIDAYYFWTDSQIVLGYLNNRTRRFQLFVARRVLRIHELTDVKDWRYVPTAQNPSDMLTRSKAIQIGDLGDFWFHGPTWLLGHETDWPSTSDSFGIDDNDPEVKAHVIRCDDDHCPQLLAKVLAYYSCWSKMQRAVAWLLRWLDHIRNVRVDPVNLPINVNEIERARKVLVRACQSQGFSAEIKQITAGRPLKRDSVLSKLNPYIDTEGILRVGGRTNDHPILIPSAHPMAKAIVWDFHKKSHAGSEWTHSLIREEFWLVKGRKLVKGVTDKCLTCRKLHATPNRQIMSNLRPERITPGKPVFYYTGVDVFGPYYVKNARSEIKRYGCVFTCMTTRAIHIEVLNSLESSCFINALRRFSCRRSSPRKIISDNGTNLKAADAELKKALKDLSESNIKQYAVNMGIDWEFIPPSSPHWGGAWERMVGLIKNALKSVITISTKLNDEILLTLMCEVENVVNNRPLCRLSDDPNDFNPLTPNHLLIMQSGAVLPPGVFDRDDAYRRIWRHVQSLVDQFWRKWVNLYLPELQKRSKWLDVVRDIAVNDLVMICDQNTPRNVWPLAIVTEVNVGRDNHVRSVRLRTRATELVRPITKLILLEANTDKPMSVDN